MSPAQRADRLNMIADEISGAENLVHVGEMAAEAMPQEEKAALAELLAAIHDRLKAASVLLAGERAAA